MLQFLIICFLIFMFYKLGLIILGIKIVILLFVALVMHKAIQFFKI